MTRIRVIAGLTAAVAVLAGGAGSAAAAPPEFVPGAANPFSSTSKTTVIETVTKKRIICKLDTDAGEVTGSKTAVLRIRFTGCSSPLAPGVACQSPNGAPGEIQTELLVGVLGYIKEPPAQEIGLDLMNPTGGPWFAFFCGAAISGEMTGSAIGRLTPINKPIKPGAHVILKFAQKAGHQVPMHFAAGPIDVPLVKFGAGPLEEAGLSSVDTLTFAAPITIVG